MSDSGSNGSSSTTTRSGRISVIPERYGAQQIVQSAGARGRGPGRSRGRGPGRPRGSGRGGGYSGRQNIQIPQQGQDEIVFDEMEEEESIHLNDAEHPPPTSPSNHDDIIAADNHDGDENDLFFVAQCASCIFYEDYSEVIQGDMLVGGQVRLAIYGFARILFIEIVDEQIAEDAARNYADTHNNVYGHRNGRIIVYDVPPPLAQNPNNNIENQEVGDLRREVMREIRRLNNENENLRNRIQALEDVNIPPPIQPENAWQNEVPQWIFNCTEEEARELYRHYPFERDFAKALYDQMFSFIETFRKNLPGDKLAEFRKICCYELNTLTQASVDQLNRRLTEIIHTKRRLLLERLTRQRVNEVAFLTVPVPLRQNGDVYVPVNNGIVFDRRGELGARPWPLLVNNGVVHDTMFASKQNHRWIYFIITSQGIREECT